MADPVLDAGAALLKWASEIDAVPHVIPQASRRNAERYFAGARAWMLRAQSWLRLVDAKYPYYFTALAGAPHPIVDSVSRKFDEYARTTSALQERAEIGLTSEAGAAWTGFVGELDARLKTLGVSFAAGASVGLVVVLLVAAFVLLR